jgi:hypothetical protein
MRNPLTIAKLHSGEFILGEFYQTEIRNSILIVYSSEKTIHILPLYPFNTNIMPTIKLSKCIFNYDLDLNLYAELANTYYNIKDSIKINYRQKLH